MLLVPFLWLRSNLNLDKVMDVEKRDKGPSLTRRLNRKKLIRRQMLRTVTGAPAHSL